MLGRPPSFTDDRRKEFECRVKYLKNAPALAGEFKTSRQVIVRVRRDALAFVQKLNRRLGR